MIRFEIDNQYFPTLFPTLVFKTFLIRLRWETFNKKKKKTRKQIPLLSTSWQVRANVIYARTGLVSSSRASREPRSKSPLVFFF